MKKNLKTLLINAVLLAISVGVHFLLKYAFANVKVNQWAWNIDNLCIMAFSVLMVSTILVLIFSAVKPKKHRAATVLTVTASMTRYVAALVILCWGLSILGVNIATIVASVGILTLIVGFGAESLIADVITGLFMIFENQYNVGDIIEIDGFRGTVVNIGIRTTSIADAGNNIRIINNSEMKNLTNKSDQASAAICDFSIPYETDLEALETKIPEILNEMYAKHNDIMNSVPVYLGVQELGASSVVLRFKSDVQEGQIFNAIRIMNHDLFISFRKTGIECPFTQITIHNGDK